VGAGPLRGYLPGMADDQDLPAPEPGSKESALRPAGSDLHPADPADDLTGGTSDDGAADGGAAEGWPADDAADGDRLADELPDVLPGDGTIEPHGSTESPDALRTAVHGREAAAAAENTSDNAPQPTETLAD
jgi:hypothetical protein